MLLVDHRIVNDVTHQEAHLVRVRLRVRLRVGVGVGVGVGVRVRVKELGLAVRVGGTFAFRRRLPCRRTTTVGVAARTTHGPLIKTCRSAGEAWAGPGLAVRAAG